MIKGNGLRPFIRPEQVQVAGGLLIPQKLLDALQALGQRAQLVILEQVCQRKAQHSGRQSHNSVAQIFIQRGQGDFAGRFIDQFGQRGYAGFGPIKGQRAE